MNKASKRGCLWWGMRFCVVSVMVFLLLAVAGVIYQNHATAHDQQAYPPPGAIFDTGDHQLHMLCMGKGSPTVILEAGLGENSLSWHLVQAEVAQTTRVCAYDRAGVGWSEGSKEPMSSTEIAQVLHTLLAVAQIEPPYLLVGHSAGGVYVRSFTHLYPDEVMGMVLVDSSHEQQVLRQNATVNQQTSPQDAFLSVSTFMPTLARLGILRLLGTAEAAAAEAPFSAEIQAALAATKNRTAHAVAINQESTAFSADTSQPNPPTSLGDLPLIVITRGIGDAETMDDLPIPNLPDDYWEQMDALWLVMQAELAALSTSSQQWIAVESGHMIPFEQPELIADAIHHLLQR